MKQFDARITISILFLDIQLIDCSTIPDTLHDNREQYYGCGAQDTFLSIRGSDRSYFLTDDMCHHRGVGI